MPLPFLILSDVPRPLLPTPLHLSCVSATPCHCRSMDAQAPTRQDIPRTQEMVLSTRLWNTLIVSNINHYFVACFQKLSAPLRVCWDSQLGRDVRRLWCIGARTGQCTFRPRKLPFDAAFIPIEPNQDRQSEKPCGCAQDGNRRGARSAPELARASLWHSKSQDGAPPGSRR